MDGHHSVEDIGICLGRAFAEALGDKRGITRYGQFLLPMDETLVLVACDLSGRDYLGWSVDLPAQRVGDFDTELGKEFFLAFVRACPMSLHIRQMARIINFAVFNVADICAVLGALGLLLFVVADEIKEQKNKRSAKKSTAAIFAAAAPCAA